MVINKRLARACHFYNAEISEISIRQSKYIHPVQIKCYLIGDREKKIIVLLYLKISLTI